MAKPFFKLPYIGPFSPLAQRKIKIIAKTYCNKFSVIPIHSVPSWFTNLHAQNVIPVMLVKSLDILALPRVCEHLLSDRNSHNYKHLQGSESLFQLLFHLRLVSYQFSTKDQISAPY